MGCGCKKSGAKMENKTFIQKVASATKAARDVLNGTAFAVDEKIKKQRLKICADCEHIQRLNTLPKGASVAIGDTCSLCGCYLKGNRVTSLLDLNFCKVCYGGTPEFVCPLQDENGKPTPKWGFEYGEFELNRQPNLSDTQTAINNGLTENVENLSEEKDL